VDGFLEGTSIEIHYTGNTKKKREREQKPKNKSEGISWTKREDTTIILSRFTFQCRKGERARLKPNVEFSWRRALDRKKSKTRFEEEKKKKKVTKKKKK